MFCNPAVKIVADSRAFAMLNRDYNAFLWLLYVQQVLFQ